MFPEAPTTGMNFLWSDTRSSEAQHMARFEGRARAACCALREKACVSTHPGDEWSLPLSP